MDRTHRGRSEGRDFDRRDSRTTFVHDNRGIVVNQNLNDRPLLMDGLGRPVVPTLSGSRPAVPVVAATVLHIVGPCVPHVQTSGLSFSAAAASSAPLLAFQLEHLPNSLSGILFFLEYQAPTKAEAVHKKFKDIPALLRAGLVKEQSYLGSLFEKLAIHGRGPDFFDAHVQSTPMTGSRASLHSKAAPLLDISVQFSREILQR